ncbi:MAG: fluoride efflux transporter CrcB [Sulfuricurvum sp.]|uniref:fluoride efflux transporter CrcB n=1 Tax=Sulfuricurvum sp. TaxID=2025608 RepID=UPI00260F2E98|nr:fluoride efflux transporter CrcB [Sulfuricurvum sp.]MDD2950778.1 fluoride efflux transporter CrcB [Sulfuricurvum sp.]MDD5119320.1 fluoride efflux transporter CrcB [Sulfuricurvum sp.]
MSWQTILAIGSGAFIGAVLRAYINGVVNHHFPHTLPFGTLSVNLIGSFIIGVLFAYFTYTTFFSVHMKSFLTTGLLGGLTTYSTFAMETVFLLGGGNIVMAAANMALNLFGSVLMAGGGFYLFRHYLE